MKTYPEMRTYSWENGEKLPIRSRTSKLPSWSRIAYACHAAARNPVAAKVWADIMQALDDVECEYNIHELSPKKFKHLLIAAAQRNEWWARESAHRGFTAFVADNPDLRRCSRCNKEKPKELFRAVMSEKRKAAYLRREPETHTNELGITHTSRRETYIHHLCDTCRAAKTKRRSFKNQGENRANARKVAPDVLARIEALRERMKVTYGLSTRALKTDPHRLNSASLFHEMRKELITKARASLDTLVFKESPLSDYPEKWQGLLTFDERTRLLSTFENLALPAWSGKGRTPSCF